MVKWTMRILMVPFFPLFNAAVFLCAIFRALMDVPGYWSLHGMTTANFKAAWRSWDKQKEEYRDAD